MLVECQLNGDFGRYRRCGVTQNLEESTLTVVGNLVAFNLKLSSCRGFGTQQMDGLHDIKPSGRVAKVKDGQRRDQSE